MRRHSQSYGPKSADGGHISLGTERPKAADLHEAFGLRETREACASAHTTNAQSGTCGPLRRSTRPHKIKLDLLPADLSRRTRNVVPAPESLKAASCSMHLSHPHIPTLPFSLCASAARNACTRLSSRTWLMAGTNRSSV